MSHADLVVTFGEVDGVDLEDDVFDDLAVLMARPQFSRCASASHDAPRSYSFVDSYLGVSFPVSDLATISRVQTIS